MKYLSIKICISQFLFLVSAIISLSLFCATPQDPADKLEDVSISIMYFDTTAIDSITIGDTLSFRVGINYPDFVDSVKIEIEEECDTLLLDIDDTMDVSVVLTRIGSTTVAITGYCTNNVTRGDTGTIFIRSIPVAIEEGPASDTVTEGEAVTLIIEVSGNPQPTVQWFRDSVAIKNATGDTLYLDSVSLSFDGAVFRAQVANIVDTCWSDEAVLTVIGAVARWDEVVWDDFVWR
jgi:hypothetical protein